jgi:chloride channel 3/4/5
VNSSGIRVWYSSFSSIDWLHDAIKDSVRRLRLRRHTSIHGRIRRQIDRSVGWIIVTIVGILTAVAAFLIVRSEQWLFELKDGYCRNGWWKAKRSCCPSLTEGNGGLRFHPLSAFAFDESCSAWSSWAEFFSYHQDNESKLRIEGINYASYTCIAVRQSASAQRDLLKVYVAHLGHHVCVVDH